MPNSCPGWGKHSTQPGEPDFAQRKAVYRCPFCVLAWSRPVEETVHADDVVRVDLDHGYAYGVVDDVDAAPAGRCA